MSNYPPGVTGSEYAIAGADYEQEVDEPCPKCGGELVEQGYVTKQKQGRLSLYSVASTYKPYFTA